MIGYLYEMTCYWCAWEIHDLLVRHG